MTSYINILTVHHEERIRLDTHQQGGARGRFKGITKVSRIHSQGTMKGGVAESEANICLIIQTRSLISVVHSGASDPQTQSLAHFNRLTSAAACFSTQC